MRIRSVSLNDRKKSFEVRTAGKIFQYPYTQADPPPTTKDPALRVLVDCELGREAFAYTLQSGREGVVHLDHVLHYNRDPNYFRNQLLYTLTLEAQGRLDASSMTKREVMRQLGTSAF